MSAGMSVGEAIPAAYALLGRSPDSTEAAELVQISHTLNEHDLAVCSEIVVCMRYQIESQLRVQAARLEDNWYVTAGDLLSMPQVCPKFAYLSNKSR